MHERRYTQSRVQPLPTEGSGQRRQAELEAHAAVMLHHQEILAVIPARGGSKGIPRKNIVPLCGKPLVAYSIQAALAARRITRVVVSTDDAEIADVARAWGAEVPFLRPGDIATDRAELGDSINYTVQRLKDQGYFPDALCVLYPTSPFRTGALLDTLLVKLDQGFRQVVTAKPIEVYDGLFHEMTAGQCLAPLRVNSNQNHLKPNIFFRRYGLLSATSLKGYFLSEYIFPLNDPILAIDIDTFEDLYFAEEVIKANLFDFNVD